MITLSIIVITCLVSFPAFRDERLFSRLAFWPYEMQRDRSQWFRFFSGGFVHVDFSHLLFNMLTLYFFGSQLEGRIFSELEYLVFYLLSLVASAAPAYVKHKNDPTYRAVGASGAVSAVVFVLVLYAPWAVIYLKFFIPLYFILYAVGYLAYSAYMAKRGTSNIGHDVHLWGALFGVAFCLLFHPESFRIFLDELVHPPFLG